jgi:hypothetical protein
VVATSLTETRPGTGRLDVAETGEAVRPALEVGAGGGHLADDSDGRVNVQHSRRALPARQQAAPYRDFDAARATVAMLLAHLSRPFSPSPSPRRMNTGLAGAASVGLDDVITHPAQEPTLRPMDAAWAL